MKRIKGGEAEVEVEVCVTEREEEAVHDVIETFDQRVNGARTVGFEEQRNLTVISIAVKQRTRFPQGRPQREQIL